MPKAHLEPVWHQLQFLAFSFYLEHFKTSIFPTFFLVFQIFFKVQVYFNTLLAKIF